MILLKEHEFLYFTYKNKKYFFYISKIDNSFTKFDVSLIFLSVIDGQKLFAKSKWIGLKIINEYTDDLPSHYSNVTNKKDLKYCKKRIDIYNRIY